MGCWTTLKREETEDRQFLRQIHRKRQCTIKDTRISQRFYRFSCLDVQQFVGLNPKDTIALSTILLVNGRAAPDSNVAVTLLTLEMQALLVQPLEETAQNKPTVQ
jgi:hypothetical protein